MRFPDAGISFALPTEILFSPSAAAAGRVLERRQKVGCACCHRRVRVQVAEGWVRGVLGHLAAVGLGGSEDEVSEGSWAMT